MRECRCKRPSARPNKPTHCVKCGAELAGEWRSSDANVTEFFNRLTAAQTVPESVVDFLALCERRELAGRDHFGYAYLDRDNISEAGEECADLALYAYLDRLRARREGADQDGDDLALTVAYHAAMAYEYLVRLKRVRAGAP